MFKFDFTREEKKKRMTKAALRKAKAAEEAVRTKAEKLVMIEKAVSLKHMCDFAVSCSYGDLVLIIAMLHDYIQLLDEFKGEDITYQAYYRERFQHIADHLASQINYDYEAAIEKCKKKQDKEDDDDIGGEALELAYKKAVREKKTKEKQTLEEPENESGN